MNDATSHKLVIAIPRDEFACSAVIGGSLPSGISVALATAANASQRLRTPCIPRGYVLNWLALASNG
jgi:hypothetical protein